MKFKHTKYIVLALLVVVLGYWLYNRDPQLDRAIELSKQLSGPGPKSADLQYEYSLQLEKLSDAQLAQLRKTRHKLQFEELSRFFTLTPEQQAEHLDKIIDQKKANARKSAANQTRGKRTTINQINTSGSSNSEPPAQGEVLDELNREERQILARYRKALLDREVARSNSVRR